MYRTYYTGKFKKVQIVSLLNTWLFQKVLYQNIAKGIVAEHFKRHHTGVEAEQNRSWSLERQAKPEQITQWKN